MRVFADYERQVLRLLAEEHLGQRVFSSVLADGETIGVDHTGDGYLLSVRDPELPTERIVLSSPTVTAPMRVATSASSCSSKTGN